VIDTRQTNRMFNEEWYTCARCGSDFPRSKVVVQEGHVRCTGDETNHCGDDEYGAGYFRKRVSIPTEQPTPALPTRDWADD
jgi:DNA-directed RNA polymerase subunit RPC12/RpoP